MSTFYAIRAFSASIYGFHEDWARNQPICALSGYITLVACAGVCYSYLVQALSRLFFTLLLKYKYLKTYTVHWCMVIFNWIIAFLVPLPSLLTENGIIYQNEARLCLMSTELFWISMYSMVAFFALPLNLSCMVYQMIWHHAKRSTQRIGDTQRVFHTKTVIINAKREAKLARNLIIMQAAFIFGGTPYFALIIWIKVAPHFPPPDSLHALSIHCISVSILMKILVYFSTNQQVKNVIFKRFKKRQDLVHSLLN